MMSSLLRNLPPFKGKSRLARLLLNDEVKCAKNIMINGKYDCSYFLPNVVENVGFDILVNGVYEQETYALLNSLIPERGCFIDVGGNIGAVTVPLCKNRPDIIALTIEAAPWIFPYLKRNVSDNGIKNVRLFNNAVYDQDDLVLDFFSPAEKFGKGSLAAIFTNEPEKVVTKTLDTLVSEHNIINVDVIKVDVEGFEYFVFKGAQGLLGREHRPTVLFEFVDWAEGNANGLVPGSAQQHLLDLGYQLFVLEGGNKRIRIGSPVITGSYNILAQSNP